HPELQATLVRIDQSSSVVRSTSVVVLSVVVAPRVHPLLASTAPAPHRRAPAYRPQVDQVEREKQDRKN
ncbi:MAG: hypothetical protein L0H31_11180, partial [Nocardioidaceae bacterium]|nr:hypothetical protein [Nocardioidaceae bacterium]